MHKFQYFCIHGLLCLWFCLWYTEWHNLLSKPSPSLQVLKIFNLHMSSWRVLACSPTSLFHPSFWYTMNSELVLCFTLPALERCCCFTSHKPNVYVFGVPSLRWLYGVNAVGSSLKRIQCSGINVLRCCTEISGDINGFVSSVKSNEAMEPVPGLGVLMHEFYHAFSCGCLWQHLPSLSTTS